MKYYDESETAEIRENLEKEVLTWSKVSKRSMFGCPAYLADGRLFAFLVTRGVVITQIRKNDKQTISEIFETAPFKVGEREITRWLVVTLSELEKLPRLMRYIKKSYQFAIGVEEI